MRAVSRRNSTPNICRYVRMDRICVRPNCPRKSYPDPVDSKIYSISAKAIEDFCDGSLSALPSKLTPSADIDADDKCETAMTLPIGKTGESDQHANNDPYVPKRDIDMNCESPIMCACNRVAAKAIKHEASIPAPEKWSQ